MAISLSLADSIRKQGASYYVAVAVDGITSEAEAQELSALGSGTAGGDTEVERDGDARPTRAVIRLVYPQAPQGQTVAQYLTAQRREIKLLIQAYLQRAQDAETPGTAVPGASAGDAL